MFMSINTTRNKQTNTDKEHFTPLPLAEPRGSCKSWPLPAGSSDNLSVHAKKVINLELNYVISALFPP